MELRIKLQKGMTLLEVLVAITLMVVISAISYASLNGLINARIHTDAVAEVIHEDNLVTHQLTSDFHSLIFRSVKNELGQKVPEVSGNYSSVEFSRNGNDNPFHKFRSELQRIRWYIRDGNLYRSSLDIIDSGSFPKWKERLYMQDITEFEVVFINSSGVQSRTWPANGNVNIPLKAIEISLRKNESQGYNYFFSLKP